MGRGNRWRPCIFGGLAAVLVGANVASSAPPQLAPVVDSPRRASSQPTQFVARRTDPASADLAPVVPAPLVDAGNDAGNDETSTADLVKRDDEYVAQRIGLGLPGATGGLPNTVGGGVGPNPTTLSSLRSATTGAGAISVAGRRRLTTPPVIGDFFGAGSQIVDLTFANSFPVFGRIVTGAPGAANAVVAFERDGNGFFNDFTTVGPGADLDPTMDGNADTFAMTEPTLPNELPPGPGAAYDGGTVVYTNSLTLTTPQPGQFDDGDVWFANYSYSQTVEVPATNGVALRRIKIAENNSPVPRDRYYFDYRFFRDVQGPIGDVNRFAFGFEKTFREGTFSLDTRLPFGGTLDANQIADVSGLRSVEFGNVTFIVKQILSQTDEFLWSGGLGVAVPTAGDTRLFLDDGRQILFVENEAVHMLPFTAALWTPNERFYLQSFLQLDVDVNGNPVRGDLTGRILPQIGVFQSATLLFADVSGGCWLFQDDSRDSRLRGVAAIAELHYNTTLQDADVVSAPGLRITDSTRRFDVLNFTTGFLTQIGDAVGILTGFTFPLRKHDDRQFDYELTVAANLFF